MHDHIQRVAQGVYQHMLLATLDLLAPIIAALAAFPHSLIRSISSKLIPKFCTRLSLYRPYAPGKTMPQITFDRYYRYDDLTRILHDFAKEHPSLVEITSLGKSYEGRDIWLATVTNTATGPASEKPALWVDGNIHASEVSPSSACLYLINKLVTQYGSNTEITRCLDTRAFYICPRFNPD